jgi:threonine dehydratase
MYKLRGIFNKMMNLSEVQRQRGVVCSSDGNLAQAVAYLCNHFSVKGTIYIPEVCFQWKVELIRKYGKQWVEIVFLGDNYEMAEQGALKHRTDYGSTIIHSYDDLDVVAGNGAIVLIQH